jgi:hypothetical protein
VDSTTLEHPEKQTASSASKTGVMLLSIARYGSDDMSK